MKINDKIFNSLRFMVEILFPAAIVAYSVIAKTWGWGYIVEIVTTLGAINTFLGVAINFFRLDIDNNKNGTPDVLEGDLVTKGTNENKDL